ncbi:MAG: hypothetical protein KC776_10650 [Myxococcales bacterium]|nr:hypothetical protein [Myxococcales bacterium]MCB9576006.1 hypothetical protein [Polyangiaceae bacterium]
MPATEETVRPTVVELLPEWLKGRQSDPDVSGAAFDANESNVKIHSGRGRRVP